MSRLAHIQAIAFDAVGTLIEPEPGVAQAYRQAALRVGLDLPEAVIRQRVSKVFTADDTAADHSTDEPNERRRWRKIVGDCLPELPEELADRAFNDLWHHFTQPASWRLFDDVSPTLRWLEGRGLRCCVASNFDSRLRQVWAGLDGVQSLQQELVISSEVGTRKPGRAFYEAVVERLGCGPGAILFLGDDWLNDVQVPAELGFETILLDRRGRMNKQNAMRHLGELTAGEWFGG